MKIYAFPLGGIFAIIFVSIIVWALIGIFVQKYRTEWAVLNGILAVLCFIIILFYTVIDRTADTTQSIPFIRTIEHIRQQPELIREMVMNLFLFFPFGLTLPYAIASQRSNKIFSTMIITILISFFLTCLLELIQGFFGIGNAELSDIIMNTVGSAIGTSSFCVKSLLLNKFKKRKD